jgi:2-polyprenyl-3-methyl-5-hydroxy-6-metoxy-1,4-benzoquinol methylase
MIRKIDDSFNKEQYGKYLQHYLDANIDEHVGGGTTQSRIALLKKYLPAHSHIFEVGSAGGIDALALQKAGYTVTPSDFSEKFVEILREKHLSAILFDAKHDEIPNNIDAIYSNAVFVHFIPEELKNFLHKAKQKLQNSKIIYLSVIKGEGSERKASKSGFARDFQYYTEDLLKKILSDEQFIILETQLVDKWIQIVAQAL